jgi:hypothetical protein
MITVLAMPNDRAKAEAIVDAMVLDGLEVWNETAIPGGERWPEALLRLRNTKCLVLCWSEAALADTKEAKLFREAASEGCRQDRAIGALLEQVDPPDDFVGSLYDLANWRLAPRGWRRLLIGDAYLRDLMQAARFKQANRDPVPPSAPRQLFLRQAALLSSAIIVPIVAGLSFTDVLLNFERRIAQTPSAEEQAAWDALPRGSCLALKEFIIEFDDGVYRERANALLGAALPSKQTVWESRTFDDEIYLSHSSGSRESDAEAEGKRRCELLVQGMSVRNLQVTIRAVRQDCQSIGPDQMCDWRGTASCSFEEAKTLEVDECNL